MAVTVLLSKSAQKDIANLPTVAQADVAAKFAELAGYPDVTGIKALKGGLKGILRARVGNYRIFFVVSAGTLTVTKVTDRKDAY